MGNFETHRNKAIKAGINDREACLPCAPDKYGALKDSAWEKWYKIGYFEVIE